MRVPNRRTLLSVAGAALVAACAGLPYEPATVQLAGALETEEHFGPPNYGETPEQDAREIAYVLVLDRPVSVRGDPSSELNTQTFTSVMRIQIVSTSTNLSQLVDRRVIVVGQLFQPITLHYVTPVALRVTEARAQ
jgi:hypothetical protein